jgi:nitrile hydratase accessory protein
LTQFLPCTNALQHAMPVPRDNGALIFHRPWESRVFAMAVLLCEKGVYAWTTFNAHFATCIGDAERHDPEKEAVSAYYHHWR